MRRLVAVAGLGVLASLVGHATPAAACDPNRFPNCQTYCGAIASRYEWVRSNVESDIRPQPLPEWPATGVAGCP